MKGGAMRPRRGAAGMLPLLAAGLLTPAEAGYRTDRKYGWAAVTS